MRRLSQFSDAHCSLCGKPAAEGLADGQGLWCEKHGRVRAVQKFERAAFDLLHTYGRDDFRRAVAAIEEYRMGEFTLLSSKLAETMRGLEEL